MEWRSKGYRSKMNSILSEYDKLDRKRMSEIQKDVIRPELDAMEQTLCKNKKSLIQSTAQDLVLVGGSIGIGIFTGLLPVDYSAVVGMIGGISSISNILDKAKKSFTTKEEIKSNSFYFCMNCKTSIENCKGILWFSIYKTDVVNLRIVNKSKIKLSNI